MVAELSFWVFWLYSSSRCTSVIVCLTLACVCFICPSVWTWVYRMLVFAHSITVKFYMKWDLHSPNTCDHLSGNMCIHVCVFLCMWVLCGGSGVWIISLWAVFREASQAWGGEEKGGIVVVQMSVIGASENRFTHGGLTETHLQQPPDPSDYDHARTPFTIMDGLNVSIFMVWYLYKAYVDCNWLVLQ